MNPYLNTDLKLRLPVAGRLADEQQIAEAIAARIGSQFSCGEQVPAMRDLAIANQFRRNIVVKAYALLAERGHIRRQRIKRFEFVCHGI